MSFTFLCFHRRACLKHFGGPVQASNGHGDRSTGPDQLRSGVDLDSFTGLNVQRERCHASWHAKRQNAHADEIGSMNALETTRDNCLDA